MIQATENNHLQESIPQWGQDVQKNTEVAEPIIYRDNGPSNEMEDPTGDYLAKLQSQPQPLTMETLKAVRDKLESRELMDEDLRYCFEAALEEFPQEPPCVQRNAEMVIKSNSTKLTFLSGKGECKITISDSGAGYKVKEPTARMYLARLHSRPQELSTQTLQGVQDALEKWKLPDKRLEACVKLALAEFRQEPPCVQDNARLVIQHKNKEIVFVSGQEKCKITVSEGSMVELESWAPYWDCLRHSAKPLSMEILERVHNKANNGKAPEGVRNILKVAVKDFFDEPSCLQKNARLVIECDEGELVFVSGKGENKVKVCIIDGKISYNVAANNWVAFCRACMKLLSELYQKCVHDVNKVFQLLQYFHIFKEIGKAIIPYLPKILA